MQVRQVCGVLKNPGTPLGATEGHLAEASALERVAAQNLVATGLLARTAAAGSTSLKPQFEFKQHPWFPVVVLKTH